LRIHEGWGGEMSLPVVVSCAFFGERTDRDPRAYYTPLLADFAAKSKATVIVYTNDPAAFPAHVETRLLDSVGPLVQRLWPDPNWQAIYTRNLQWHTKNQRMAQARHPSLGGIYLAKTALLQETLEEFGDVLWLDAGFLFSVYHDHTVPPAWAGYDPKRIESELIPMINRARKVKAPFVALKPRKSEFWKNHRPTFNGMSYSGMERLARKFSARTDGFYTMAGMLYAEQSMARALRAEFSQIWKAVIDSGQIGTEENVMSVLRWKYRWPGLPLDDWAQLCAEPPMGWTGS
jgi:hypothetical protein